MTPRTDRARPAARRAWRAGPCGAALFALWLAAPWAQAPARASETPREATQGAAAPRAPDAAPTPGGAWAAREGVAAGGGAARPVEGPSFAPMGLALLAVLGLMAGAVWILRRMGLAPRGADARLLRIVSQLSLGPRERLLIVEAGDRWLLLGVGSGGISRLGTLPRTLPAAEGAAAGAGPGAAASFQGLLDRLRKGGTP